MNTSSAQRIYMIGIKGTGMSSLALYLCDRGVQIAGWDVPERFLSEDELVRSHIRIDSDPSCFKAQEWDAVIYSSAHEKHQILTTSVSLGLPRWSYHEYLGMLSTLHHTIAVAGTHGKSTASGCIDFLLKELDITHGAIYGARPIHNGASPVRKEDDYLVLEACEYRKHFLSYSIDTLLVTNIEWEHVDFYENEKAVEDSFRSLIERMPPAGTLVISMNSPLCRALLLWTRENRQDLTVLTYGRDEGEVTYSYDTYGDEHQVTVHLAGKEYPIYTTLVGSGFIEDTIGAALAVSAVTGEDRMKTVTIAGRFAGCKGRVERLSDRSAVWHLYSDYAHHPSEIRSSISSLRLLHPGKRIVLCFYPHTVSRTRALWDDFVSALSESDVLFIAPVSSTARKDGSLHEVKELSERLCLQTGGQYAESDEKMTSLVLSVLHEDDVCVTMGAGNTYGICKLLEKKGV
ncbi:MAG: hypothetical protein JXK93_12830 [Sphaerochaetaceae bacterium]|nr:hypothetical protein [Sphaerochaetaceae bacterium]